MAYELHIARVRNDEQVPILLEAWLSAVSSSEGVRRFAGGDHKITNPKTGEIIFICARNGDAEVYFPDRNVWLSSFRWSNGAAHFNARSVMDESMRLDVSSPVWRAASALAARLDAVIRGDEGEMYDPRTGSAVD